MLNITNLTAFKIEKKPLDLAARLILKELGMAGKEVSLVFLGGPAIRNINEKYRHKNKATDVLSFEGLNEIFICPRIVKKQAELLSHAFKDELMRIFIHGILHLAGHDHEKSQKAAKEMAKTEENFFSKVLSFK